MTLSDLWPPFQGHKIFWRRISLKRRIYYCTIGNYMLHVEWYHVCWPRQTAKRVEPVVSISWASCYRWPQHPAPGAVQPAIDSRQGPAGEEKVPARCPSENSIARRRASVWQEWLFACFNEVGLPYFIHYPARIEFVLAMSIAVLRLYVRPSIRRLFAAYRFIVCYMFDCIILRQRLGFSFLFPIHSFSFSLLAFLHTNADVCHEVGDCRIACI